MPKGTTKTEENRRETIIKGTLTQETKEWQVESKLGLFVKTCLNT
jgi:hypothetical protein